MNYGPETERDKGSIADWDAVSSVKGARRESVAGATDKLLHEMFRAEVQNLTERAKSRAASKFSMDLEGNKSYVPESYCGPCWEEGDFCNPHEPLPYNDISAIQGGRAINYSMVKHQHKNSQ